MQNHKYYQILKHKLGERHFEETLLFISIGVISAVFCSAYAMLFSGIEHLSVKTFTANPLYFFIASPLALVVAYLLVRWFAPGSSGSGIPQVMACIEHTHQHLASKFLRKAVIVVKILSSLIGIFAGAAIGREGPSLQISAAIAHNIGKFFEKFNIKVRTEQLLVAGAASGLAAAFNTPIGGIVYAIEELSKEHVRKFKDVLLLSVVLSGLTAQLIVGNYLYLGYPVVPKSFNFTLLLSIALLAIICGFLGCLFSKMLTKLSIWRGQRSFTSQLIILVLVGLTLASLFYFLGPGNIYSGTEAINQALFSNKEAEWTQVLSRFFTPLISSMTGIAGGIFAPSLSAGAALGSYAADFIDPSLRTILALSGMVAFLTGVTHTPITSFILVLEMTDRHGAVLPMMIAAVCSSIGARFLSNTSFYEDSVKRILQSEAKESET